MSAPQYGANVRYWPTPKADALPLPQPSVDVSTGRQGGGYVLTEKAYAALGAEVNA